MKKAFTLLAILAAVTSASFAQYNQPRDNHYGAEVAVNNKWDRNDHFFSGHEKDMQISAINYDYNRRIESVKNRFFMGRAKKERIICSLELQRDAEIRAVINRFESRRNDFDPRDNGHDGDWHERHDRRRNW